MGLDITAYRHIQKAHQPTAECFVPYVNSAFPGRAGELEDGACYSFEEKFSFRAGSYSGYNEWRDILAKLAGYPAMAGINHSPHAESAWQESGGPFHELIHFADNEGTIGAVVAAKLARDFRHYQPLADGYEGWWREGYRNWRKAFEMAADGGAVDFH